MSEEEINELEEYNLQEMKEDIRKEMATQALEFWLEMNMEDPSITLEDYDDECGDYVDTILEDF